MSSISPFRGYNRANEAPDDQSSGRRRLYRRRILIISISSIFLVAIILAAIVGTSASKEKGSGEQSSPSQTSSTSIKAMCALTTYPGQCSSSLENVTATNVANPDEFFLLTLQVAMNELLRVASVPAKLANQTEDRLLRKALANCHFLMEDSIYGINSTILALHKANVEKKLNESQVDDLKTWLSAALTNFDTCLDGLENTTGSFNESMHTTLTNSTQFTSNSLAVVAKILELLSKSSLPIGGAQRRLLSSAPVQVSEDGFPTWLSAEDRRLLRPSNIKADIVVAKDGSGDFATVNAAVAKAESMSSGSRFIIYVKKGVYTENVLIGKKLTNIMLVGDGMDQTTISGSLNVVDGTPTFSTGTLIVEGKGFMAKDIGFRNTAGPAKHQAVAVRCSSDFSVFYRCKFDAYQDTLYAHSNRQFYKDCTILGTVDFIFGNAAALLQDCKILPREPMSGQQDTITAQSKSDPNQNTGISIHRCQILPSSGSIKAPVYLGRPWKAYSTTVVMETTIGSLLNPAGWLPWTGNSAPDTIFYAEYKNSGPGAGTSRRVKWKGYHPSITDSLASTYTVGKFLGGNGWLPATGVPFTAGL
ncbi:pectinesterase-like [Nymphaea colorata]|nr:pectinesterase-like [Nymphaea colorata]